MTARKRIETMREAGTVRTFGEALRKKFDPDHVPTENRPGNPAITEGLVIETDERVTPANNLHYVAVDLQAAAERIRATTPGFNLKYELRQWKPKEAQGSIRHEPNIQQIKAAKRTILRKCVK